MISFSDRMFPTKAVRIWREGNNASHISLVQHYYEEAGRYSRIEIEYYVDEHATWYRRGYDPIGTRA